MADSLDIDPGDLRPGDAPADDDRTAADVWADVPMMARFALVLAKVERIRRDQEAKIEGRDGSVKFTYGYTTINSVLAMLKPILAEHHLALSQPIKPHDDGSMVLTTTLICPTTGESLPLDGMIIPAKGDPQAVGSAITYYRRYSLVSAFALEATDDDDGGAAHRANTRPGNRTPAETEITAFVKALPSREQRDAFKAQFRAEFGTVLSDLPESRHGDALTWTKAWEHADAAPSGDDEDAAWVADASGYGG